MSAEPGRLTVDELLPLAVAIQARLRQRATGDQGPLHPLPLCPACGQYPTDISTGPSPNYFTHVSGILFEPCGHQFNADNATAAEAVARAARIVDGAAND